MMKPRSAVCALELAGNMWRAGVFSPGNMGRALLILALLTQGHGVAHAREASPGPLPAGECEPAAEECEDRRDQDGGAYEIIVRGEQLPPGTMRVTRAALLAAPEQNLGAALARIPGVDLLRKAPNSLEPVVRGLSGERVQTRAGGVPLYGACPSRMDPPLGYLGLQNAEELVISRGLPSVTWGPVGAGGAIDLTLDYERPAGSDPEIHADAFSAYDSAYSGFQLGGAVEGGTRWIDLRATGSLLRYQDYTAPAGQLVPAHQEHESAALFFGLRPAQGHRLSQGVIYKHEAGVLFPSLPMDNIDTDFWLYTFNYRVDPVRGALRRLVLRGGLSRVDHLMDNRNKPNRQKLRASTPAETVVYSGGALAELRLSARHRLEVGLDGEFLGRDAVRTRELVAAGKTFKDHVWPDASRWDLGAFAEFTWSQRPRLTWTAGLRADLVGSAIAAGGDPSLGGFTVAEQYVRFYGEGAATTDRAEFSGAAQCTLRWRPLGAVVAHLGTGLSTRPASVTERYFAFGPAPGGFQVGNPALAPEKKWIVETGIKLRKPWLRLDLSGHYSWVGDFIHHTAISRQDVDGDGAEDLIRGYRNVTAHLLGFELAIQPRLARYLSFPATLSYVRAWNTTDGRDLPEIPPLRGTAAARVDFGSQYRWWGEVGLGFALPQRNVDESFPEEESEGYAVLGLRAGIRLWSRFQLRVAVENLIDTHYSEHLTREALLAAGDLMPGDEVPAPGRRLILSLRGTL